MSLMLKLLTIISLLSISSYANKHISLDERVLEFEEFRISSNDRYKLEDMEIFLKQPLPLEGWTGYVISLKLNVNGKTVNVKDTLFTNGEAITPDLKNVKTGRSYKNFISPKMPDSYYNDEHFIAGNKNAKNKIVIFSDPLCPFCIDFVPDVINHVKKYPDNIALYYYHFPLLRIHPAADTMTKAMAIAHKNGYQDLVLKVYQGKFERFFEPDETDNNKILNGFNKVLKTDITLKQINQVSIVDEVKKDEKLGDAMMVSGTPTIFINGKIDRTRVAFKEIK